MSTHTRPFLPYWIICSLTASLLMLIGFLSYLDHKRTSDPSYRQKVTDSRRSARCTEARKLESRMSAFPAEHDFRGRRTFALCRLNQADAVVDTDVRAAAECLADAMYMLSCVEAGRLLRGGLSPIPSDLVRESFAKLP